MKILVAVKSYHDMWHRGAHDKIRDSWGLLCPGAVLDLRFFLGGTPVYPLKEDEVHLAVPDVYRGLSAKANAMLLWAVDRQYDYVVLADTDTFLHTPKLAALPWGSFDYAGQLLPFHKHGFMFGGCGIALSRDAVNVVLNNEITHDMDDVNIGNILLHRPQPDVRILPQIWDRRIGWHFPKNTYSASKYDPQFPWMDLMAQAHLGFPKKQHRSVVYIGGATREIVIELGRMDREAV
ncbi:MAG TPA: hypothetical protein VN843_29355 [Anaerolineales bacterium]|nr:hypothetical protein [Anaerolineales bacterium]